MIDTLELKNLFQQEFAKMVAVISKLFGLHNIQLAEDIVSETFLTATENWEKNGRPENPVAWLYAVAKQKTLYHFRRNKIYTEKVLPQARITETIVEEDTEEIFSMQKIRDSQLQMLFAICNPAIASEAQIGLALRILCGFGIEEIAEAFLSNKETINKRLFRAKEKLRTENVKMEMPDESALSGRLDNVLHIIYLLFNEGYYSTTQNQILRKEFCIEALRLGLLLTDFDITDTPKVSALVSLMCFHASRFDARQSKQESMILYKDQDPSLWDEQLIAKGMYFLERAASGEELSSYHIEARIAYFHCIDDDTSEKWEEILQLYNELLLINYSPSVALNRTYALYRANGAKKAITEAEKLQLTNNHFYFVLLGELYSEVDKKKSKQYFEHALTLIKTGTEKEIIYKKLNSSEQFNN